MVYDLKGKVIILTGANSGIGKAATKLLAADGATVIMACRSQERGAKAQAEIVSQTGNQSTALMLVDMSSQVSINQFAAEFIRHYQRLDAVIHNAANFDLSLKNPVLTADGVETIFATNHVGVFLLTDLLLDMLKHSAPSRVVTVASKGLMAYPFLDIEFDNLNGEKKFNAQHAYYHSKLAQVMYTYELAERLRGSGVTANCVRVGNVALADDRLENIPEFMKKAYELKKRFAMTPEAQARTYEYLTADPIVEGVSGGYWDENNRQVKSGPISYRKETWDRLWQATQGMIRNGVKPQ